MGVESCEKSESFVATFGRKLSSITLFVHARYGARKVCARDWWNAEACWFKIQKFRSPPREGKTSNTQPLSRTLNLARWCMRRIIVIKYRNIGRAAEIRILRVGRCLLYTSDAADE